MRFVIVRLEWTYLLSIVWRCCWLVRNLSFMYCSLVVCVTSFVISIRLWSNRKLSRFRSRDCGIHL